MLLANSGVEACQEHAAAYGMHGLTSDLAPFDWHAKVKAQLEEQFSQYVLIATTGDYVIDAIYQVPFQITGSLPSADVGL